MADKRPSSQSYGFSSSHVWMWKLDYKESWAPKNWWFWTVVLEKTFESPLDCKEIQPVHPKGNQSWIFTGRTDAKSFSWSWNSNTLTTWWKEPTHCKRPWCWERLKVGEEGDDRGWDGWMESSTPWTWIWASSGSWWWIGKPGMLQSMGLQRVGHDWATGMNWTEEMDYIANITSDLQKRFNETSQGLSFSKLSNGRGGFCLLKICPLFNQHSWPSWVLWNIRKRRWLSVFLSFFFLVAYLVFFLQNRAHVWGDFLWLLI